MAFDGLLSQIANPQMADIAGAIDYRKKRLQDEQQRQKDEKVKELIGKAIPHLREGSTMHELATTDPERFMMVGKVLGIPLDQASMFEQEARDVRQIAKIMQSDPEGAIGYADTLAAEREKMGLDASKMRGWAEGAKADIGKARNIINMMDGMLNRDLIEQEKMAERKMRIGERQVDLQEAELEQKAKQIAMGGGENADVQSSNILDDGTVIQVLKNTQTRVIDPMGNVLSGQARADAIKAAQEYGADIQASRAGGRTRAMETEKGKTGRENEYIDQGASAAQSIPVMKRAISLLDSVESGGIDKAAIAAKQMFGVESANEGELSYLLAKNVLGQLKGTFGAAFTAAEGDRLATIEANLGRSPAANKRIIAQALQIAEKKAKRGIDAAVNTGDDFAASDIEEYMKMDLSPAKQQFTQETAAERFARLKNAK